MMDTQLAANFLRHIEDSRTNGVPELHFRFWNHVEGGAKNEYIRRFRADPVAMAWYEDGFLGEDPDFNRLLELGSDTLGYRYARHVIDNALNKTIASDYRRAHEQLDAAGKLAGMPDEVKYAVLRGFQVHDYFHILTGYKTTGWGEMALQAFTLAQRQLPYSSLWMATLTAQMTFVHPDMTVAVMDAISDGWQYGRSARNLNYTRWEDQLGRPVADLRDQYGLRHDVDHVDSEQLR